MFFHLTGDQEMTGGSHYWELCPLVDWKSFSVGVAYRASLGRFDQLGKNSGSWCLHASQWLQSSLCVKHNNRVKALDWPLPQRIGIYCDYNNGLHFHILPLVFYVFILILNPSNKRLTETSVNGSVHREALFSGSDQNQNPLNRKSETRGHKGDV